MAQWSCSLAEILAALGRIPQVIFVTFLLEQWTALTQKISKNYKCGILPKFKLSFSQWRISFVHRVVKDVIERSYPTETLLVTVGARLLARCE